MIFLASSLVMMWFVILSGVTHTSPLSQTYFLRANTDGISGARPISQWTYFYVCGDGNTDCSPPHPAPAIGSAWDGEPRRAPPAELLGGYGGNTTSFGYWYMWRFGWVFYLIALFFGVLAFFSGFVACCSRLGSAISGLITLAALVFYTIAVSLMTATFVKMRNAFIADNRDAELGRWAFGFSWGAWAALLISTILFCLGRRANKADGAGPRRTWGRRRMSTHSRKSYDGRRVKEEYP
ncbi:actin cortical patch SUR7/pH-response regulator pali [Lasiosphaeris hirsuta]|uniref:Actin cortical patch SUR7/pH-response regulator pali n=1 Tax=Lasiosphaeris hirsuta TaxID=260670 RepID=A0AA40B9G5_9PEZI|nr:actin cortical patch SUR7/pH-response regulator pali [Lasiosphaeris hirsuta]